MVNSRLIYAGDLSREGQLAVEVKYNGKRYGGYIPKLED